MLYQILPKKEYQFEQEKMNMFFKTMVSSSKKSGFSFKGLFKAFDLQYIIDCDAENKISLYMNIHNGVNEQLIVNAINVLLSDKAVIFPAEKQLQKHDTINTLYFQNDKYGGKQQKSRLATFMNEGIFTSVLGMMQPSTRLTVDFRTLKSSVSNGNKFFQRGSTDVLLEIMIKVSGHTKYSRTNVKNISESICSLTASEESLWIKYKDVFNPIRITGSEAMNLIQIPTLYRRDDEMINRIYHLLPGQVTLKKDEFSKGIYVGTLYHPIQKDRKVYISYDHMRKHAIISGTTGSGKSSEIEEWIDQILIEKLTNPHTPGFTFIDPLESSALGVIDKILKLRDDGHDVTELLSKVRYVDFSTDEYIFPISLLNPEVDSTETLGFFKSLYGDTNTIQVDRMLTSAIRCLLLDKKEHPVFDIEQIFSTDPTFREKLVRNLSKNIYAEDEIKFLKETRFNQSIADPILNRLASFKNTPQKKLMFAMTSKHDSLKDIKKWMDEGYIILFNLKGQSEFDTKVIMGYISTQYYLKALSRPDFSMLHLLITDETHKVQMPIFPKIVAELRKAGLSLVSMTQMLEQFNPDFLEQLVGNLNTIISFKQKSKAAFELQKRIPSQDVSKDDLMQLPSMIGYLSMEEGGKERSILIKAKPPYRYTDGKMVNHEDPIAVQKNLDKNRKFARELMARDYMSKQEAEHIVFKKRFASMDQRELEEELITAGDSLINADATNEEMIEKKGDILWDE